MQTRSDRRTASQAPIPAWALYGEEQPFPDILHIERITDRAAGLDWRIAPHRHLHMHQFFLVRDGETELTLDGRRRAVAAPFLLSIPPGVVHGFHFSAGTEGFVLTVPLQSLPPSLRSAARTATGVETARLVPPDADASRLFNVIHQEHGADRPARLSMLQALATELACLVLRATEPQAPAAGTKAATALGAAGAPHCLAFLDLINQHLRDGWRPADYARAIGISTRHLNRVTRSVTGQTAVLLIEAALMREACRLLVYTRAPIAAVGYDLGFEDPSYFSRAFRRAVGQSPGAYRAGFESA